MIHEYAEPFDPAVAIAKMRNGKRWPRSEYLDPLFDLRELEHLLPGASGLEGLGSLLRADIINREAVCDLLANARGSIEFLDDVIDKMTMTHQQILQEWDRKRDTASNAGTWMHAMFEHVLNGLAIVPGVMSCELELCMSFLRSHSHLRAYRTEWAICAPDEDLAGSIDLVLLDPADNRYVLVDWKRSEKLPEKYNGFGRSMKAPADSIPDCQGHHYRLQLNIYKWILSKYYKLDVKQMLVVCTHHKFHPSAFVDEVPDLSHVVDGIMHDRRSAHSRAVISPTVPFDVDVHVRPTQNTAAEHDRVGNSQLEEDLGDVLERIIVESEEAIPEAAKKRRLMKGASESKQAFDGIFLRSTSLNTQILDVHTPDVRSNEGSVLLSSRKYLEELRVAFPGHSEHFYRLILISGFLAESRLPDRPMLADIASIVWMIEGERYLRVHRGFLYVYTENGAFVSYAGTPPESVLFRITTFFVQLEGILRRLRAQTSKDASSVAKAIVADRQSFPDEISYLDACRRASREPKGRHRDTVPLGEEDAFAMEDGEQESSNDGDTWTQQVASKAWKLSYSIKYELMNTRIVSLLVEWCETPDQRRPAVCYDDVCMVYDSGKTDYHVHPTLKDAANDCYVYIPHSILDPVLQVHQQRLEKFYSQTFWCNHEVFECCQAALAIAKRGFNVDRCFIGQSPGGVGQSLYSQHIAEMYKHNHAFFDPNVWHNEEELRKQVEAFARCFVLTGQEAPESAKKLHTDLYKKTMSGDGITGRKPYGYTTRMFSIVGWKRLEVNRMMSFQGVTLGNFNSIMRRALVWKPRARFLHPQFLEAYPDHERDGFFASDPSLGKFLATDQASVAGLRLQHAFEATHSKDECYELIENYVNGGDSYLTEDMMRTACSMPVRERHAEPDAGIAAVVEADGASQEQRDNEMTQWKALGDSLLEKMLSANAETLTYYEFSKKYSFVGSSFPNMSKDKLWDNLIEKGIVVRGMARHKGSKDKDKDKSGTILPRMTFAKNMSDLMKERDGDAEMNFLEEHDLNSIAAYAEGVTMRATNNETLLTFHHHVAKQAGKDGKVGRRSADLVKLKNKALEEVRKLEEYQKSLDAMMSMKKNFVASGPSKRRRLHRKEAASEKVDIVWDESTGMAAMGVHYHYVGDYTVRGRRYAQSASAQLMPRRLQYHALEPHTFDLDIFNCCPTILKMLVERLQPSPPMPADLKDTLRDIAVNRQAFVDGLGMTTAEGKQVINKVLNGGAVPENLKTNSGMLRLQRLSLYLRWLACNALYDDYRAICDKKNKEFPSATTLHLLWTAIEDWAIDAWTEYLITLRPPHLSLHFDGVRVSRSCASDVDKLISDCEKVIADKTGFNVKIAHKKPSSMTQLFASLADTVVEIRKVPEALVRKGNCIPCAMWHSMARHKPAIEAGISDTKHRTNARAVELGYRDYRQTAKLFAVNLMGAIGMAPLDRVKNFMLHTEGTGNPHCIAVSINADETSASVLDGATHMRMSIANFKKAFFESIDKCTVVSFWDSQPGDKLEAESLLLDLQAGSSEDDCEDSETATSQPIPIIADDNDEFRFEDQIVAELAKEVDYVCRNLGTVAHRHGGHVRCPLCPFRSFKRLQRLRSHVIKHHTDVHQYVCSGTKQIKVISALHDHVASRQQHETSYLQRSSDIIRASVRPPLSANVNNIDKQIRLVFFADGPRYIHVEAIGKDYTLRRVRNLYYDHAFADKVLTEMVLHSGQVACHT